MSSSSSASMEASGAEGAARHDDVYVSLDYIDNPPPSVPKSAPVTPGRVVIRAPVRDDEIQKFRPSGSPKRPQSPAVVAVSPVVQVVAPKSAPVTPTTKPANSGTSTPSQIAVARPENAKNDVDARIVKAEAPKEKQKEPRRGGSAFTKRTVSFSSDVVFRSFYIYIHFFLTFLLWVK